jgi:tyrosyl-tRNA synthetase
MEFYVAPDVLKRFPKLFVGGVVARRVDNARGGTEAAALLEEVQRSVVSAFAHWRELAATSDSLTECSEFAIWRSAFAEAGIESRHVSSVEALYQRVIDGGPIPSISPVVDLVNALSLKHKVPIGAHDVDALRGSLGVRFAGEGTHFTPVSATDDEIVPVGEIVYADGKEVRTRRWVWRQSAHGRVTAASRTIFFPIDGFAGVTDGNVTAAADELAEHLQRLLGAKTRIFFVDATHSSKPILRYALLGNVPVGGDAVDEVLGRGVVDLITREELEPRLRSGEKLKIKLGFDPTGPLLHVGRSAILFKLRQFQALGHTIQFLVGNFTGLLGDASDKTAKRQMLTSEQVETNMATYVEQVGKILDVSRAEVRYNADWLSKLGMADVIRLASEFTVAQMIERENFIERYRAGKAIGLHEFLYPLLQGYDSVVLKNDVEIGGTDQLFNMLAGRVLQRAAGLTPQAVITGPLISGTNGEKMSTSVGNVVNILDAPETQYFAIMRLLDELMIVYFETCTTVPLDEIRRLADQLEDDLVNPVDVKRKLARTIVGQFHGEHAAIAAERAWDEQVRGGGIPSDIPVVVLDPKPRTLPDLLVELGLAPNKSAARRNIEQGAVSIDGTRVTSHLGQAVPRDGMIVKFGRKQWAKIAMQSTEPNK